MTRVNKVILIGNVGKDPEVRYNPSGGAWVTLSLATTRNWKNRETGERQEETEWHRVVFNDRLAEIVGEYVKKGRPLYVEGRLKTRKWQDKEGKDQYTTEIIATEMQMLGGREGMGGGAGEERGGGDEYAERPQAARPHRRPPRAPAALTTWTTTFRSEAAPRSPETARPVRAFLRLHARGRSPALWAIRGLQEPAPVGTDRPGGWAPTGRREVSPA